MTFNDISQNDHAYISILCLYFYRFKKIQNNVYVSNPRRTMQVHAPLGAYWKCAETALMIYKPVEGL